MFAYPIPWTPSGPSGFTELTFVPPGWFNYLSTNFARAIDGVGGGYYQITGNDIRISSDLYNLRVNAPAGANPIELRGFVTIGLSDDANYATGTGGLTIEVPSTFMAAMAFAGAVTFNSTVSFGTGALNGDIKISGEYVTRAETGVALGYDPTEYGVSDNGSYVTLVDTVTTLPLPLTPPHGSTLTDVFVMFIGAGGHTNLPANMPTIEVGRVNLTTGATDTVGTGTDSSADVSEYQATHSIAASGMTEIVDRTLYRYYVTFTSEFGTDALAGGTVIGSRRTTTMTKLDKSPS